MEFGGYGSELIPLPSEFCTAWRSGTASASSDDSTDPKRFFASNQKYSVSRKRRSRAARDRVVAEATRSLVRHPSTSRTMSFLQVYFLSSLLVTLSGSQPSPSPSAAPAGTIVAATKIANGIGGMPSDLLDNEDRLGRTLYPAGDIDGDDLEDIAVWSRWDEDGATRCGAVYIMFLQTDGTARRVQKISATTGGARIVASANSRFGSSMSKFPQPLGEQSELPRLIVSQRRDDTDGVDAGLVFIFRLHRNGTVANQTVLSNKRGGIPAGTIQSSYYFGAAVSGTAGDLDGDGFNDVLVSAQEADLGGAVKGALFVLYMRGSDHVRSLRRLSAVAGEGLDVITGTQPAICRSLVPIRNRDGSNSIDIVYGERNVPILIMFRISPNGTVVGAPRKFGRGVGGIPASAVQSDGLFGEQASSAGDVNGDGIEDLIVSAHDDSQEGTGSGAFYILFLNPENESEIVGSFVKVTRATGSLGVVLPGTRMQAGGTIDDLNGDSRREVILGMQLDDTGGMNRGAVVIGFMGGAAVSPSPSPSQSPTPSPTPSPSRLPSSSSSPPSFRAVVYQQRITNGESGVAVDLLPNNAHFSTAMIGIGDWDGNGTPDFAASAPSLHQLHLFLVYANFSVKEVVTVSPESLGYGHRPPLGIPDGSSSKWWGRGLAFVEHVQVSGTEVGVRLLISQVREEAIFDAIVLRNGTFTNVQEYNRSSPGVAGVVPATTDRRWGVSVASADVDGDGNDDIIVGDDYADSRYGLVWVLFRNSSRAVMHVEPIGRGMGAIQHGNLSSSLGFGYALQWLGRWNDGTGALAVGCLPNGNDGVVSILSLSTNGTVMRYTSLQHDSPGVIPGGTPFQLDFGTGLGVVDLDAEGPMDLIIGAGKWSGSSFGSVQLCRIDGASMAVAGTCTRLANAEFGLAPGTSLAGDAFGLSAASLFPTASLGTRVILVGARKHQSHGAVHVIEIESLVQASPSSSPSSSASPYSSASATPTASPTTSSSTSPPPSISPTPNQPTILQSEAIVIPSLQPPQLQHGVIVEDPWRIGWPVDDGGNVSVVVRVSGFESLRGKRVSIRLGNLTCSLCSISATNSSVTVGGAVLNCTTSLRLLQLEALELHINKGTSLLYSPDPLAKAPNASWDDLEQDQRGVPGKGLMRVAIAVPVTITAAEPGRVVQRASSRESPVENTGAINVHRGDIWVWLPAPTTFTMPRVASFWGQTFTSMPPVRLFPEEGLLEDLLPLSSDAMLHEALLFLQLHRSTARYLRILNATGGDSNRTRVGLVVPFGKQPPLGAASDILSASFAGEYGHILSEYGHGGVNQRLAMIVSSDYYPGDPFFGLKQLASDGGNIPHADTRSVWFGRGTAVFSSPRVSIGLFTAQDRLCQLQSALGISALPCDTMPVSTVDVTGPPANVVLYHNATETCRWPPMQTSEEPSVGSAHGCPGVGALPPVFVHAQACGPLVSVDFTACSGSVLYESVSRSPQSATVGTARDALGRSGNAAIRQLPSLFNVSVALLSDIDAATLHDEARQMIDSGITTASLENFVSNAESQAKRRSFRVSVRAPEQGWTQQPDGPLSLREGENLLVDIDPDDRDPVLMARSTATIRRMQPISVAAAAADRLESLNVEDFIPNFSTSHQRTALDAARVVVDSQNRSHVPNLGLQGFLAVQELDEAEGDASAVCVDVALQFTVGPEPGTSIGAGPTKRAVVRVGAGGGAREFFPVTATSVAGDFPAAIDLSLEACISLASLIEVDSGEGGAQVTPVDVTVPARTDTQFVAEAQAAGQHPTWYKATQLLQSVPKITDRSEGANSNSDSPFPIRSSLLVASTMGPSSFVVTAPMLPNEGEAAVISCQASQHVTSTLSSVSTTIDAGAMLQVLPRVAVLRHDMEGPPSTTFFVSKSHVLGESNVFNDTSDKASVWVVCVLAGTSPGAARALQEELAVQKNHVDILPSLAALPGPGPAAVFGQPLAAAIPVRVEAIVWPRPADLLTRLPDAVWGSAADGATVDSPAPGSAADLLGRRSRYLSAFGDLENRIQPNKANSEVEDKYSPAADQTVATEEVLAQLDQKISRAVLVASTGADRSLQIAPSIIVSGAADVVIACPVSSDGTTRIPCIGRGVLTFVGGTPATVVRVSPDRIGCIIRLPTAIKACGTTGKAESSETKIGFCPPRAILIANPPEFRGDGDTVRVDWPPPTYITSSDQQELDSARRLRYAGVAIDGRTQQIASDLCGSTHRSAAWRQVAAAARDRSDFLLGCIIVGPAADSPALNQHDMTEATAALSLQVEQQLSVLVFSGGIEYVEQCVGYPEPGGLCANAEAVKAGLVCAFGAGEGCRPCPVGAVCPGGYKARPLPGYWTSSEDSGEVLRCAAPADRRCLGWDAETNSAVCGNGYKQGSVGCSRCNDGRFPRADGACELCPSSPSVWLLLQPIVLYICGLLGAACVLMAAMSVVAVFRGISLALAAKRAFQFALFTGTLLQTVAQAGRAVQPGLPQWYYTVVATLDVFRFESSTLVHPNCLANFKLGQEIVVLGVGAGLAVAGFIAFRLSAPESFEVDIAMKYQADSREIKQGSPHTAVSSSFYARTSEPHVMTAASDVSDVSNPLWSRLKDHRRQFQPVFSENPSQATSSKNGSHQDPRPSLGPGDGNTSGAAQSPRRDVSTAVSSRAPGVRFANGVPAEKVELVLPDSAGKRLTLPSRIASRSSGDGSGGCGIVARVCLTALALLYSVICTTFTSVVDCRVPESFVKSLDELNRVAVELPAKAIVQSNSINASTAQVVQNGTDPSQVETLVLLSYGHDSVQDKHAILLVADPSVKCYQDAEHLVALSMAAITALLVLVGLPFMLHFFVVPEIDRTVELSSSLPWMRATRRLCEHSACRTAAGSTTRVVASSGKTPDGCNGVPSIARLRVHYEHQQRQLMQSLQQTTVTSGPQRRASVWHGPVHGAIPPGKTSACRAIPVLLQNPMLGRELPNSRSAVTLGSSRRVSFLPGLRAGSILDPYVLLHTGLDLSPELSNDIHEMVRDRSVILSKTHRLAYFVDGDYRASRAWVRAVDWGLLLCLAGLERVWVLPMSAGSTLVLIAGALQIVVLLSALIVFEVSSPYLQEYQWKRLGKAGVFVLSCLAVALNAVAAIDQNQSISDVARQTLHKVANVLAYLVGISSISCLVALFVMFWWTILQEDPEGAAAVARRRNDDRAKAQARAVERQAAQQNHANAGGLATATARASAREPGRRLSVAGQRGRTGLRRASVADNERLSGVVPGGGHRLPGLVEAAAKRVIGADSRRVSIRPPGVSKGRRTGRLRSLASIAGSHNTATSSGIMGGPGKWDKTIRRVVGEVDVSADRKAIQSDREKFGGPKRVVRRGGH